ncbi:16S rRNA (guanine(966)-N(2))-methyltransferase RsmD [Flavimobilis sp. GY10621]|uniref:16S rRNA (Guanine(966)-N(2))-methyltransferase RsmD n=1 Tax=Flavimobilis rhizosphaerae TaxID=2775421 RepID=A0ABR9DSC4_9MICO|nr:16S rRNA (guanine(966)-N(2))-methyltransferase RsmD [Flavimobilis rhizosphaerae]MBD9700022.1 16S rRNA (guanine(966)-N(2))-methyltransferase RsmD [Flavimobilis rhizosphaerae]
MTRIVAGRAGGRSLKVPPKGTRPTSDRVREAMFSRLEHYDVVDGARVLDLFAGSGALGLEAASRGAAAVVLVDASRQAADVCRTNAAATGLTAVVTVVVDRAERVVAHPPAQPWDLVLVDPPYDLPDATVDALLEALAVDGALTPGAVVVVERSRRTAPPTWPTGWSEIAHKDYGETSIWYGGPDGDDAPA